MVVHGGNGVLEVVYHGMIASGGCIIYYYNIYLSGVYMDGDVGCICM